MGKGINTFGVRFPSQKKEISFNWVGRPPTTEQGTCHCSRSRRHRGRAAASAAEKAANSPSVPRRANAGNWGRPVANPSKRGPHVGAPWPEEVRKGQTGGGGRDEVCMFGGGGKAGSQHTVGEHTPKHNDNAARAPDEQVLRPNVWVTDHEELAAARPLHDGASVGTGATARNGEGGREAGAERAELLLHPERGGEQNLRGGGDHLPLRIQGKGLALVGGSEVPHFEGSGPQDGQREFARP